MPSDSAASPPIELSPRAREIVAAARELLEAEGSVSMRRLADRLGIKAPSLYKHLRDKGALEHPHLYRLMFEGRLPRERLVPGAEERAGPVRIRPRHGHPRARRALPG